MHAVLARRRRDQLMAKHKANHVQVAYAPDADAADRAATAKAAFFDATSARRGATCVATSAPVGASLQRPSASQEPSSDPADHPRRGGDRIAPCEHPLDQPGELRRRQGRRRPGDRGHRRGCAGGPRAGLEGLAQHRDRRRGHVRPGRDRRPGAITHIWLTTHPDHWRSLVLRAYWDGAEEPAIEVPVGDFFGQGWGRSPSFSSRRRRGQPARRVQLLLADAVPRRRRAPDAREPRPEPPPSSTSRSPTRPAATRRGRPVPARPVAAVNPVAAGMHPPGPRRR